MRLGAPAITLPDLRCKECDLLQTEASGAVTQFEAAKSGIGTGVMRGKRYQQRWRLGSLFELSNCWEVYRLVGSKVKECRVTAGNNACFLKSRPRKHNTTSSKQLLQEKLGQNPGGGEKKNNDILTRVTPHIKTGVKVSFWIPVPQKFHIPGIENLHF